MHFMFIAPRYSYVTDVLVYNLHITIFSRVYSYVLVYYSYVLVCTRLLLVCARVYSYFTRMLLVCYSCVVLVTIDEEC